MGKSIEEMRVERASAKIRIAEEKKLAKRKPPRARKEKKYADGGEEQFESVIAPPRPIKGKTGRDNRPLYETYQLETGEYSFSPRQLGAISLYGVSANRCYGWNTETNRVTLKPDSKTTRVWFYDVGGVFETLASDPRAIKVRERYGKILQS